MAAWPNWQKARTWRATCCSPADPARAALKSRPDQRFAGSSSGPGQDLKARRRKPICRSKLVHALQMNRCILSANRSPRSSSRSCRSDNSLLACLQERLSIDQVSRTERTSFSRGRREGSSGPDTASPSNWTARSSIPYRFRRYPPPSPRASRTRAR